METMNKKEQIGRDIRIDEDTEFTDREKKVFAQLPRSGAYKCPDCNFKAVMHLPVKIDSPIHWDNHIPPSIYPRVILKSKQYYCFNCKKSFNNVKTLAIIDGIFLNKNIDLKKRSQRYIEEICKALYSFPNDVERKALEILDLYNGDFGKRTSASAIIYLAGFLCGGRRTQKDICEVAQITTSSLRIHYRKIAENCKIEIIC